MLLVDDDHLFRRALARHLHKAGLAVLQAADLHDGLALLSAAQAVIADFHLGEGQTCAALLIAAGPRPKIVVTAAPVEARATVRDTTTIFDKTAMSELGLVHALLAELVRQGTSTVAVNPQTE